MKCLRCWRPLGDPINEFGMEEYHCICGVRYSKELIDSVDIKEWDRMRHFRLFSVDKREHAVVLLVHSTKGRTVHPLHYKIYRFLCKKGWVNEWAS